VKNSITRIIACLLAISLIAEPVLANIPASIVSQRFTSSAPLAAAATLSTQALELPLTRARHAFSSAGWKLSRQLKLARSPNRGTSDDQTPIGAASHEVETGWNNNMPLPSQVTSAPSWWSRHSFLVRLSWAGLTLGAARYLWTIVASSAGTLPAVVPIHETLLYALIASVILIATVAVTAPSPTRQSREWNFVEIFRHIFYFGIKAVAGSFIYFTLMQLLGHLGWPANASAVYVAAGAFISTLFVQMADPTDGARIVRRWLRVSLAIAALAALFGISQPAVWDHFFNGVPLAPAAGFRASPPSGILAAA
jgi:hypothetical protein